VAMNHGDGPLLPAISAVALQDINHNPVVLIGVPALVQWLRNGMCSNYSASSFQFH